jgi:hypothetical protein
MFPGRVKFLTDKAAFKAYSAAPIVHFELEGGNFLFLLIVNLFTF